MGKIFGISDLPVSTIMTPFEPVDISPKMSEIIQPTQFIQEADEFVPKTSKAKTKSFIRMRNGWGKLMKSFSKKIASKK